MGQEHQQQPPSPAELYAQAESQFGAALLRLARGYEADPDKRRDLLQEMYFQLWRSLAIYDGRCSLRTWVFRVAHNAAASHVLRAARSSRSGALVSLEEIQAASLAGGAPQHPEAGLDRARQLEALTRLIAQLKPLDRQVILCYLEDLDARAIGEITGLSSAAVAMKVHRIKALLASRLRTGSATS